MAGAEEQVLDFFESSMSDFCVPDYRPASEAWASTDIAMEHQDSHTVLKAQPQTVEPATAACKATAFIRELSGLSPVSSETMMNAVAAAAAAVGASVNHLVPSLPLGSLPSTPFQAAPRPNYPAPSSSYPQSPAQAAQHGTATVPLPTPVPLGQVPSGSGAVPGAPTPMPPVPPPLVPGVPGVPGLATGPLGPDGLALSPTQLGELELARQRAARAAAGRRQQLIAQKRAREASRNAAGALQQPAAEGGRSSKAQAVQADASRRPRRAAAGVSALTSTISALQSEDGEAETEDEEGGAAGGTSGGKDAEVEMTSTGDPVKDARKLKRLLRNRVSAQQARERKKQYVTTLEEQVRGLQGRIAELEQALGSSEAQNEALRRIIRNMQQSAATDGADATKAPAMDASAGHGVLAAASPAAALQQVAAAPATNGAPRAAHFPGNGHVAAGMLPSGAPVPNMHPHAPAPAASMLRGSLGGANTVPSNGNLRQALGGEAAPAMQLQAEGSGTSSHPGPASGGRAGEGQEEGNGAASRARRQLTRPGTQSSLGARPGEDAATGAAGNRPCRAESPDFADVEAMLLAGGGPLDEDDDCLVVPQAPPLTLLQPGRATPPQGAHSQPASGAGSLDLRQDSF